MRMFSNPHQLLAPQRLRIFNLCSLALTFCGASVILWNKGALVSHSMLTFLIPYFFLSSMFQSVSCSTKFRSLIWALSTGVLWCMVALFSSPAFSILLISVVLFGVTALEIGVGLPKPGFDKRRATFEEIIHWGGRFVHYLIFQDGRRPSYDPAPPYIPVVLGASCILALIAGYPWAILSFLGYVSVPIAAGLVRILWNVIQ